MAAEGWGKKQICTKGAVGGGVSLFALPSPPTPTVHSNCKSNMAGRINDRELIKLARTNKTPAQQAYKIDADITSPDRRYLTDFGKTTYDIRHFVK